MDTGGIDNDTRGWIMCVVSAIACIFGGSIICVDIFTRYIPRLRTFRIDKSHTFQSLSYSFSFGVLLFSALYSILPSSKKYLIQGGLAPKAAAGILLGGFVGGFIGISIVSRFVHSHTNSYEVTCGHSHDEEDGQVHSRNTSNASRSRNRRPSSRSVNSNGIPTESTPLMSNGHARREPPNLGAFGGDGSGHSRTRKVDSRKKSKLDVEARRPSLLEVRDRVMSFVKDTKTDCDSLGPCYGYTGVCGQQCFRQLNTKPTTEAQRPSFVRGNSHNLYSQLEAGTEDPHKICDHIAVNPSAHYPSTSTIATRASSVEISGSSDDEDYEEDPADQHNHHHHVHDNPYTDISYQTSIAIALHKIPEGFMTYATNHANPNLGFSVFMALFVHNITEGFALALPIYLATQSRMKALLVTAAIGGVSQPLGAGAAALWFKIAGREGHAPGSASYGVMFAITAGVMTSVALSLFKEGMEIGHNRESCVYFAFFGMSVMALSNALTS